MRFKFYSFAAMALFALSGCTESSDIKDSTTKTDLTTDTPIAFSTYLGNSSTVTRAGAGGDMTTDKLHTNGFGVFAYYTGTNKWATSGASTTPNYMYNTKVSGQNWTYSPTRYWPNPTLDDNDAVQNQYVSFFAYAPYAELKSGEASGITALSSNSATGAPTVTYSTAAGDDGVVDLLWGTAGDNGAALNNGDYPSTTNNAGATVSGGNTAVNVDLTKMNTTGKINFHFKHATAKFGGYEAPATDGKTTGGVTVDVINDQEDPTSTTFDSTNTRVTIKSLTITAEKQTGSGTPTTTTALATTGTLNLATGAWTVTEPASGAAKTTQSLLPTKGTDESSVNLTLNNTVAEPTAMTNMVTDGNKWAEAMPAGVTENPKTIYAQSEAASTPLIILPGQTPSFVVTIEYVVRTLDPLLSTKYTEVTQKIRKTVTFGKAVELNKKYNLAIHLGLTSVKFDATVEDWGVATGSGEGDSSSTTGETQSVDLPINVTDTSSSTTGA